MQRDGLLVINSALYQLSNGAPNIVLTLFSLVEFPMLVERLCKELHILYFKEPQIEISI